MQDKAKVHIAGQIVPSSWTVLPSVQHAQPTRSTDVANHDLICTLRRQVGTDFYFAEDNSFDDGEVVVLNRSDGSTKFGLLQKLNEPEEGVHTILVEFGEDTNSVKTVRVPEIGKLKLDKP